LFYEATFRIYNLQKINNAHNAYNASLRVIRHVSGTQIRKRFIENKAVIERVFAALVKGREFPSIVTTC
jgi:hypothetical protein